MFKNVFPQVLILAGLLAINIFIYTPKKYTTLCNIYSATAYVCAIAMNPKWVCLKMGQHMSLSSGDCAHAAVAVVDHRWRNLNLHQLEKNTLGYGSNWDHSRIC